MRPKKVSDPLDTVLDTLFATGKTISDLPVQAQLIFARGHVITFEDALLIEQATGISATFLMEQEKKYRESL